MRHDEYAPAFDAGDLFDPDCNVIVMNQYRTDTRFPHIATVEAYWHALRGNRVMPRRAEVDPRGIENALEYAFILEQIAPGVGRLRIAGSHLSDILGMEVRGMPLSAFFMPDTRDELAAVLTTVCAGPRTASLSLQAEPGFGKPVLEARVILLPLRDGVGAANRILGCFDTHGSIGQTPRRFAITSQRLTQITGHDVARDWDDLPDRQGESGLSPAFSESQASFGRATPRALDKPAPRHLRLVTSQE
jgi:hypothetical protein